MTCLDSNRDTTPPPLGMDTISSPVPEVKPKLDGGLQGPPNDHSGIGDRFGGVAHRAVRDTAARGDSVPQAPVSLLAAYRTLKADLAELMELARTTHRKNQVPPGHFEEGPQYVRRLGVGNTLFA